MSKGIIVVDIPENCGDCAYFQYDGQYDRYCGANGEDLMNIDWNSEKPDWCPIKPLPEKLPEHEPVAYKDNEDNWINRMKRLPEHCGWNACLDVILED